MVPRPHSVQSDYNQTRLKMPRCITGMAKCGVKLFIHSQALTAALLRFGKDKWFHHTIYDGCNYLSLPGWKLIHFSERGTNAPRSCVAMLSVGLVWYRNCLIMFKDKYVCWWSGLSVYNFQEAIHHKNLTMIITGSLVTSFSNDSSVQNP